MGQVPLNDLDATLVFQPQGAADTDTTPQWLVMKRNAQPAGVYGRGNLENLTLRDLYHIAGYRVGASPGTITGNVPTLTIDDIHALGRAFSAHLSNDGKPKKNMPYPDKVYSCCCCADAEDL